MGVFNTVFVDSICPACGRAGEWALQCKYGECWQYKLKLGDSVAWGSPVITRDTPLSGRGWITAFSEGCPHCHHCEAGPDFAIVVQGSRLVTALHAPLGFSFPDGDARPLNDGEDPIALSGGL